MSAELEEIISCPSNQSIRWGISENISDELENLATFEKRIQIEKEREGDLRALASLFEGEGGFSRLEDALATVRELLLEVKTIQEDLTGALKKLHDEDIEEGSDDLEELDDMGERMNRLLQY
jgi:septation ring formation regulator EzrA